jgi:hypothetical protein
MSEELKKRRTHLLEVPEINAQEILNSKIEGFNQNPTAKEAKRRSENSEKREASTSIHENTYPSTSAARREIWRFQSTYIFLSKKLRHAL